MRILTLSALILLFPFWLMAAENSSVESATKTLVWPDGTRYVGGVEDGKRAGKGTIFWQDGTRFIGQFKNDMRNGPGTMILPDGTVYSGFFKDDELMDSPAEGSIVAVEQATPGDEAESTGITRSVSQASPGAIAQSPGEEPEPGQPGNQAPVEAIFDKQITALTDDVEDQLTETVDLWIAAWSDKNVPQYLSNYSEDFQVPGNQSRKSWEKLRRSRLKRPRYISIDVDYEQFELVEANVIDVFFKQTYSSNTYSDVTSKVLRLRKEDHAWKILVERNR